MVANSKKTAPTKKTVLPLKTLYSLVALVTLSIYTGAQDPINPIKQVVLFLFSAWLLPKILYKSDIKYALNFFNHHFNLFRILFIVLFFQLISAFTSKDIITGLLGDHQRRNGFLTYLCLSIIFIYTTLNFRENLYTSFAKFVICISIILGIYGFIQVIGKDFVDWNNPYNNLILTVGNPNFASSILGILGILLTSIIFSTQFKKLYRVTSILLLILFLCLMVSSNSIQGLVVFIVGASSFVGFYLYKKNGLNLLTLTYLISLLIFFCIAILGTLQRGLFKSILYKESVSIRGFYWRAAIEMFKDNPIFGVGTDQYGTFFRKYRESSYALRYGFEITSSNAHNVYLQFFATCGILVGVSYILLVLLIFKYGAQTLKSEDNHNLFFGGIFFAWIGYIIQGLISIDNISLGIWGWLLGGAVLSNSLERFKSNLIVKKSEITFLYSSFCIFITFIFCTFILRAEIDMQNQMRISNIENTSENRRYFIGATDKVFQNPVSPLFYKRIIAERLFDASETNLALNRINNLINKNPYICEYYYSRIIINQNLNNNLAVIKDQEKLLELDPWGAGNMYNLGLNYKYMGDYDGMNRIKNKLLKFAAESKIGNLARINLVSP